VDEAPLPCSGTGPNFGLIHRDDAYTVWTRLPDDLVHFSLESMPSQDCSEKWSATGVKEDLEFHWVARHLIQSSIPPYSDAAQLPAGGTRDQLVGISLEPPRC
jgi:hypothetical protein